MQPVVIHGASSMCLLVEAIEEVHVGAPELTLGLARVPQATTTAPRKDMLFLNTNGRFLTVYNPAKHTVHLSTAPAAYGISTPALSFEDALQGTRFTPPDGPNQVATPFAEGQKLRLLRILTAAKSE